MKNNPKNVVAADIEDASEQDEAKTNALIGAILGHLRRAEGLSQTSLAEKIGLSREEINDFETGAAGLSFTDLEKIAQALNFESRDFIESVDAYHRLLRR
ncbi:MAG: helix-turn-helix transcriptional regulator [Pseudomonadota bacterium]